MTRRLYTLALWLLLPWAVLHLLWRSRRQKEYLRHWNERFGGYDKCDNERNGAPTLWIHAVSVGETRAAQPLVKALREQYPSHRILLTQMTPTGRQTAIDLFDDTVTLAYLSYDFPFAVKRFLDCWQPEFGLVMETELWPNLVAACKQRGIPLLLVNGRLSERSARRYARFAGLTREAFGNLAGISVQAPNDAARLRDLGIRDAIVLGNLKFDIAPPPAQLELGATFRARLGDRRVLLCASTRDGEEALILDAWRVHPIADTLLAIVPRHPQRLDDVARLIEARGFLLQRRSDNAIVNQDTAVWLGDSMGEMFAYYAACDVAFVGGSLLDHGGQNLIEPCAVGRPVLVGLSTYNFGRAADDAIAAGACRRIANADELIAAAGALMENAQLRNIMGAKAHAFANAHRGATARTMEWIAAVLERFSRAAR